jgi:hypothetical protein
LCSWHKNNYDLIRIRVIVKSKSEGGLQLVYVQDHQAMGGNVGTCGAFIDVHLLRLHISTTNITRDVCQTYTAYMDAVHDSAVAVSEPVQPGNAQPAAGGHTYAGYYQAVVTS